MEQVSSVVNERVKDNEIGEKETNEMKQEKEMRKEVSGLENEA